MLDDDGYLTITDRKADVIIRGGENISALEVEEVLLGMPGAAEGGGLAPDERAALDALAGGGLLPPLRLVQAVGPVPEEQWPLTRRA